MSKSYRLNLNHTILLQSDNLWFTPTQITWFEKKMLIAQPHPFLRDIQQKNSWGKSFQKHLWCTTVTLAHSFILWNSFLTLFFCFFWYLAFFFSFILPELGRFLKVFFITWINIKTLFSSRLPWKLQPSVHLYIIHLLLYSLSFLYPNTKNNSSLLVQKILSLTAHYYILKIKKIDIK